MTIGSVMLDLVGTELLEEDIRRLQHPAAGGIILFSRNFESKEQLQQLVADVRAVSNHSLIIAVDHEGGRVQRFQDGFTRLPPMAWLGRLYDQNAQQAITAARELGWLMAAELRVLDIDISFAPVLDLGLGICDVIGDRSFHSTQQGVIDLTNGWMQGMHNAGMATTGKHFPGHGAVSGDSHLVLPIDSRPFDEIAANDLQPFSQLADEGMDAVMPAHVVYEQCDSQPAGFSRFWLQSILRQKIGFDGVIFSDDLSMEGAVQAGSYPQRAEAAFSAGCDMVLVCNNQAAADEVLESVVSRSAPDSEKRLLRMLGSNVTGLDDEQRKSSAISLAQDGVTQMQEDSQNV